MRFPAVPAVLPVALLATALGAIYLLAGHLPPPTSGALRHVVTVLALAALIALGAARRRTRFSAEPSEPDCAGQAQLTARVLESAREGIVVTDRGGVIQIVNPAFTRITGYTAAEAIGQTPRILRSNHHDQEFYAAMWSSLLDQGAWSGEIWNRAKSGEVYPEWLSIGAVRDEQGRASHYVAVFHDLSELKRSEDQIRYFAQHDALTGLPNRLLLDDRLEVAIAQSRRSRTRVAVLFLDVDDFKRVNDEHGHIVGDAVLREVGCRLQSAIRDHDTVARIGGDEFVIVLTNLAETDGAARVARKVTEAFDRPMVVGGIELVVTVSVGVAFHDPGDGDASSLLCNADLAMYRAKAEGRNLVRVFDADAAR